MRWQDKGRNVLESFASDRVDELIIDKETEGESTLALESIRVQNQESSRKSEEGNKGQPSPCLVTA